jgi:hypothetical protein
MSEAIAESFGLERRAYSWSPYPIDTGGEKLKYDIMPEYPFICLAPTEGPCWFLKWAISNIEIEICIAPIDADLNKIKSCAVFEMIRLDRFVAKGHA